LASEVHVNKVCISPSLTQTETVLTVLLQSLVWWAPATEKLLSRSCKLDIVYVRCLCLCFLDWFLRKTLCVDWHWWVGACLRYRKTPTM